MVVELKLFDSVRVDSHLVRGFKLSLQIIDMAFLSFKLLSQLFNLFFLGFPLSDAPDIALHLEWPRLDIKVRHEGEGVTKVAGRRPTEGPSTLDAAWSAKVRRAGVDIHWADRGQT